MTPPSAEKGFGSKVLDRIVTGQFRGEVNCAWLTEGRIAKLRIPTAKLAD